MEPNQSGQDQSNQTDYRKIGDNVFKTDMSQEDVERATRVVEEFNLKGYSIRSYPDKKTIQFRRDFHEATVYVDLIDQNRWGDVRQIFRATQTSTPQVMNFAAPNEWSRGIW